ncbi:MAG: nitroreductase [Clostridiales bacterium]|nr:nitroreductase [Clostridiales bacterium]
MDALQAISKRRSIRSYKNEQIPDSALEKILAAGSCAPVAGSFQMSVIQNPELLKKINDITKKAMLSSGIPFSVERASLPGYEPLYGAPTLIVLFSPEGSPTGPANASCAAENMLIAATALGLGSCYLASPRMAFDGEDGVALAREAGIPEGFSFNCAVIVGYTKDDKLFSRNREDIKITYIK